MKAQLKSRLTCPQLAPGAGGGAYDCGACTGFGTNPAGGPLPPRPPLINGIKNEIEFASTK